MKKRKKRLIRQWVLLVFLVLVVLSIPATVPRLDFLEINNVEVLGTKVITAKEIKDIAFNSLNKSYFGIYPKNNIFLFSKKDITKNLREKFYRISAVDVSIENFQTLSIEITEREPNSLWCESIGKCFFLDEAGLVFAEAPEFTDSVFISFWGELDNDHAENPLGTHFLNPNLFREFNLFLASLRRLDLLPTLVKRTILDEYEIILESGEKILISTSIPFSQIVSNLSSLLSDHNLSLRSDQGLSVSSLDLRYGNKVFFVRKTE